MATVPTVHVIAPFHSRLVRREWSHCGFTQLALHQIEIFRRMGCRVIDYSNHGSESTAHEHREILPAGLFDKYFTAAGVPSEQARIGEDGWRQWMGHLVMAMHGHDWTGDQMIVHTFADAAAFLMTYAPRARHIETHVGYDRPPFGAARVFVSEAWRHFHFGKYPNTVDDRRRSWVVPPYCDEHEWPVSVDADAGTVVYLGRLTADKGMSRIREIAAALPEVRFKLAGPGAADAFPMPPNVEAVGVLPGEDRAAFLGGAAVQIAPTEYVEPGGFGVVQGMLCGTPAVTSDYGGFIETVQAGLTGFRATTLGEWIQAIGRARSLSREQCAAAARERFTLEAAEQAYTKVFRSWEELN